MENRIIVALKSLGLSDDASSRFAELVDSAKQRIFAEGMVVRGKAKPARAPAKATAQPKKIVKLAYRPKGAPATSYAGIAAHTLAKLEGPRVTYTPTPKAGPTMAERVREALNPISRTQADGPTVQGEISKLEAMLERDTLPDWQRLQVKQRLLSLRLSGDTPEGVAAGTLASLRRADASRYPKRNPAR